jgi:hypothetical protein
MHRSSSNPNIRDNRLDLIGMQTYPRLMVECLHAMSLLSLESAVLADSLPIENILAIYMLLLIFYLGQKLVCFSINMNALMLIYYTFSCSHDHRLFNLYN